MSLIKVKNDKYPQLVINLLLFIVPEYFFLVSASLLVVLHWCIKLINLKKVKLTTRPKRPIFFYREEKLQGKVGVFSFWL